MGTKSTLKTKEAENALTGKRSKRVYPIIKNRSIKKPYTNVRIHVRIR